MSEQILPQLCVLSVCCLWPGLWAFAAYHIGRHGFNGAVILLLRKAGVGREQAQKQ